MSASVETKVSDRAIIPAQSDAFSPFTFTLDQTDLDLDELSPMLKVDLWAHQSRIVRAVLDFETAQAISTTGDEINEFQTTNRLKILLQAGAGKTAIGVAIVCARPVVDSKPIYFIDTESPGVIQERIFPANAIIRPTFVIVRPSTYAQWIAEIERFSTLRVLGVSNLMTLKDMVTKALASPVIFNSSYDIVVISNTTTAGASDTITANSAGFFRAEVKSKSLYILAMNALSRKCFSRIIYDDGEFHVKIAPMENAFSCIYMSATHDYTGAGKNKLSVKPKDETYDQLALDLEFTSYDFSRLAFAQMPTIKVTPGFLEESLYLSRGFSNDADAKLSISAMPAEPEIWLVRINNGESKKIDIIDALCNDAKIMESVNNLERQSFGAIIKNLMAERFVPYKKSMELIAHYEAMDIEGLALLPAPPPGASFQADNIARMEPIEFSYRDIVARVNKAVEDARALVAEEVKILERVRNHLGDGDCAICMDPLNTSPAAIMTCCNNIIHYVCALNCRNGVCAFCRTAYTSEGTFVCMHHETDVASFMSANTAREQLAVVNAPEPIATVENSKLSILNDILNGRHDNLKQTKVRLRSHGALLFDESVKAEVEANPEKIKALVYCSANGTLCAMENDITIDRARLTRSSAATATKVSRFNRATKPTAILADTWRDAAGINFREATDIIVINYIDTRAVVEQMFGRGLRAGRASRLRIWLLAFNNECTRWLNTFVRQ